MLRSNIVGTLLALATLAPGESHASDAWEPIEAPLVTLLDPGEEPRRALRYGMADATWTVARRHRYDASIKLPLRGKQGDTGVISLDFRVRPVAPSGDEPVEIAVQLLDAIGRQGQVESLAGATGLVRYTDRGLPVAARWDAHAVDADAAALADRMLLDRFRTRASHLPTPLPEESVGAGARWEIRQTLVQGASSFTMIAICTLVEDRGEGLDLQCRFSHDAEATTFSVGNAARRQNVEILESDVRGQSLVLQPLHVPVPVREDGSLTTFFKAKTRIGIARVKVDVTSEESWSQVVRGEAE